MGTPAGGMRDEARVPKILGADVELGNFVLGLENPEGSGFEASRRLLREISGVSGRSTDAVFSSSAPQLVVWPGSNGQPGLWTSKAANDGSSRTSEDPRDHDRRFLPTNGGCCYIDLDHLEIALPETWSAFEHVAYWRAMLEVARQAMMSANERMPEGWRIQVLANCSDGLGHSYGSHTNVLVTKAAWENIFHRKPHYLAYLAAFQTSSIVFTGQGKVSGGENGKPASDFQLSQRGDFFDRVVGPQTTFDRPLVNSREEALCGRGGAGRSEVGEGPELARLHVIFFDSTLCQVASLLRVGTLQIIVAMIEAGHVDADLTLDDPLAALEQWNADPTLAARARTTNGSEYTAVESQLRFLEAAKRFVDAGGCNGIVPRANEIVDLWEDTLHKLRQGDFDSLSRRLDWVLKRNMLQRVISQRSLTWTSPELKHLDQLFASLDQAEGLFWAFERAGAVDRIVDDQLIRRALDNPPDDTRAWTRAHLLRVGSDACEEVDWDVIRLRLRPQRGNRSWLERRSVHLPVPYGATRDRHKSIFQGGNSLEEIVDSIESSDHAAGAREAIVTPDYPVC